MIIQSFNCEFLLTKVIACSCCMNNTVQCFICLQQEESLNLLIAPCTTFCSTQPASFSALHSYTTYYILLDSRLKGFEKTKLKSYPETIKIKKKI